MKKYLLLFFLLLFCSLASAYSLNNFKNENGTGNLTFNSATSLYKNISIPYWASVTSAALSLKGYTNYCYKESANISSNCSDSNTGKYSVTGGTNIANMFDGNWDTFGELSPTNQSFYVNYTLPSSTTGVIWQVKSDIALSNITIPLDCFNQLLQLKIKTFTKGGFSVQHFDYYCFDGSSWLNLLNHTYGSYLMYEEGIYLQSYPTNISIKTNNQLTYQNLSNFTGTVSNINLNKTSLQNCINSANLTVGNVDCQINFSSASAGILEYNPKVDYSVFLNITFKEELTDSLILENLNILLKNSSWENTYTTSTGSYKIDDIGLGTYSIEITSASYDKKVFDNYYIGQDLNYLTAYLINSSESTQVDYHVVDKYGVDIENALITTTRNINGSIEVVSSQLSNVNGIVINYLDPTYEYTVNVSKSGYDSKYFTVDPSTSTSYIIGLMQSIASYDYTVYKGFTYSFSPANTVLNNNTVYNFTFTLNSTHWSITSCNLYLRNSTDLISSTSGFSTFGCYLNLTANTTGQTALTLTAVYTTNSSSNFTHSQPYTVKYTYQGEFSFKTFIDDLTNFGDAGFDDFGRSVIALIVMMAIVAGCASYVGWDNKEALVILTVLLVWFFCKINWLHVGYASIPTEWLKQYLVAVLASLAGGAFLLERYNK